MKVFEEIKKLKRNSKNILEMFNEYVPKWKADRQHYDKTDYKFSEDSRNSCSKGFMVHFISYEGFYGNSSVSTVLHLDDDVFKEMFFQYLNSNKKEIMLYIASEIDKKALSLREQAEKELESSLKMLKQLDEVQHKT